MFKNYDDADLGIAALMLIAVALIVTGHPDVGVVGGIATGIAGIARGNGKSNGGPDTPK